MTDLVVALAVNVVVAAIAITARAVRLSAAGGGLLVGTLIYLGAGWRGFVLLIAFFVLGVLLTRLGYRRKAVRGLAEPNEGRRGSAHALANGGAPALCALGMLVWPEARPVLSVAFGGALASALADTAGSEVGQLIGRRPISPVTFRPVPAGTEGAVSAEGTLASVGAALAIALSGLTVAFIDVNGAVAVALGGIAGSLLESVVGSFPWSRALGHMALNFGNTLVGAVVGVLVYRLLGG